MNFQLTVQVPRSPDLTQVMDHLRQKLDLLLFAFHPELVQLQGRLVRHTSREGVLCRLNLHLPTGQLSSERTSPTAQTAFRGAGEELLRQLSKHKERLRETRPRWKAPRTRARREPGQTQELLAERRQKLAGYFGGYYDHLLAFVRRQVRLREALGEIRPDLLDPHEVLDEVVVMALSERPDGAAANRGRWLLLLAVRAIRRLAREYGDHPHGEEMRSLDQPAGLAATRGEEDSQGLRLGDVVASSSATPEERAENVEAMQRMVEALRGLPAQQRHDVVLYLLEGFRVEELAALSHRAEVEVVRSIETAEVELRQRGRLPEEIQRQLRPVATSRQARVLQSLRA